MSKVLVLVVAGCIVPLLLPRWFWEGIDRLLSTMTSKCLGWRRRGRFFRARQLQECVGQAKEGGAQKARGEVVRYKFYTTLFLSILQLNRTYGSSLRKPLGELQRLLSRDIKFEKKLSSLRQGTYWQFVLIALVVWGFSFATESILEVPKNLQVALVLIALQGGGAALFIFLDRLLRQHSLSWFEKALEPLSAFYALLEVGLSCSEIRAKSQIFRATDVLRDKFPGEHLRLTGLLTKWERQGVPIAGEWHGLLQDIWALGEESFERYQKRLEALKFAILALFFLGSHFVYLSSLFDGLLP